MRRFSAAVAGTIDAARAALRDGIGGNLSGGTHHGFPDHSRKQPSHLDVGLPDGTGDAEYLDALACDLPEVLDRAGACILFYQAGVDPPAEDALGRLSLSHSGLRERDRRVLETARQRSLPAVLTLGGGYAKPLSATIDAHVGTYEVARALFG